MKHPFLFSVLICYTAGAFAQSIFHPASRRVGKPPIDTSVLNKWPMVTNNAAISNDGHYTFYTIINQPVGSGTMVLRAINGQWQMEFPGIYSAVYTDDSKKALFLNKHDSLCLVTLGSTGVEYIPNVKAFKLFKKENKEWLIYQLKAPEKKLVLQDLATGSRQSFDGVMEYWLSNNGNVLVLKTELPKDSKAPQSLNWVNITDGKTKRIWEGNSAGNLVLDEAATQLAFTVTDTTDGQTEKSFWSYKTGTDRAVLLATNQMDGIDSTLKLESIQRFSKAGSRLFITLKEKNYPKLQPNPDAVKVDVWSYTDIKLQSQQLHELASGKLGAKSYAAVLDMNGQRIIRLQQENEDILLLARDDVAIITKTKGGANNEWYWNACSCPFFYIVSTNTGERKQLTINYPYRLSPGGKYLIGSDSPIPNTANDLLSYDLETNRVYNMTQSLGIPKDENEVPGLNSLKHRGLRKAAWLAIEEALLVYDKYDIWHIDPSGKKAPVNLTNGYGRRHHIVFRLTPIFPEKPIANNEPLILSAFDKTNKNNGFYRIVLGKKGDPQELSKMEAVGNEELTKARNAEIYIVWRQTAAKSPNYFWTSDFKTFTPLSDVYPEKMYNWLSSGLITWKTFDGTLSQGALYKPENFDPNKKYPVIFNYYEDKSDELNRYKLPEATNDEMKIAWFVSNGYLVFMPDIHFKIGQTGQSVYNAVVSAAKYLAQFPWVDAKHMGIQGHSFGGYETNYIVTHTNLFAAAMSASGGSDLISAYGSVAGDGSSAQYFCETHQYRLGYTIWERPDIYIENSPIFRADKVTTPLLMMNNKKDGAVPFDQGVEFFTALRRLGKKVWMLQYDDGVHSLYPGSKDAFQHTVRMTQFFDHYLKGAPAPRWMTRGIPANRKGIDDGLEFDQQITTPGPGLLMEKSKPN